MVCLSKTGIRTVLWGSRWENSENIFLASEAPLPPLLNETVSIYRDHQPRKRSSLVSSEHHRYLSTMPHYLATILTCLTTSKTYLRFCPSGILNCGFDFCWEPILLLSVTSLLANESIFARTLDIAWQLLPVHWKSSIGRVPKNPNNFVENLTSHSVKELRLLFCALLGCSLSFLERSINHEITHGMIDEIIKHGPCIRC